MSALQAYKDFQTFKPILADLESVKLTLYMNRCDNEMTEDVLRRQQCTWRLAHSIHSPMARNRSGWSTLYLDPTTYKFELDAMDTPLSPGIKWELVDEWEGSGETFMNIIMSK